MYENLSVFLLVLSIVVSTFLSINSSAFAQFIAPTVNQTKEDIFRVGITIFGVDNKTGNIFSVIKVNNNTVTRMVNATRDELTDHNGIVESIFSFPNQTITNGAPYTACILVVNTANYTCARGYNSPSPTRTEFSQFVLK